VAKTRVHELAKTYGIESKEVLDKLKEMGEFVKSASSTIELPVEMKFKKTYGDALLAAKAPAEPAQAPAEKPAAESAAQAAAPMEAAAGSDGAAVAEPAAPVSAAAPAAPAAESGTATTARPGPKPGPKAPAEPETTAAASETPESVGTSRHPAAGQQPLRVQPGHGPTARAAAA
jgi:translation initiation factor IF-2